MCNSQKKPSGRGWGWPRVSTRGAFDLSIHPDHKYIWFKEWGSQPLKSSLQVGDGVWPPGAWAIRYLICLVTLIINIYGLGVGFWTIKPITSVRRWGMTARGLSYKAFNLPSHPDHKYIWLRGADLNNQKVHFR
jgi:hypothetical protein